MIINSADVLKFSDISKDGYIDLTNFAEVSGEKQDGQRFMEFLIPHEVLPIENINQEAFDRYKGEIRLLDPVIIKDPMGLFEREQIPPYYYLTLHEV